MIIMKLLTLSIVVLCTQFVRSIDITNDFASELKHNNKGRLTEALDSELINMAENIYNVTRDQYMQYVIPQQYIIGFDETKVPNVTLYWNDFLRNGNFMNVTTLWYYQTTAFTGVTVAEVDDTFYNTVQLDPNVVFIEPDVLVTLDTISTANWQSDPPNWGLDRIDQLLLFGQGKPLDHRYNFDQTGQGVYVFVVDTGIRWGHEEFANDPDARSRIICGFDAFNFYHEPEDWNNGCYDGVGHGTHMAGIIGGSVYGVAKDVALVSVKVITDDGRGSVGSVLAGFDYLMRERERTTDVPMVANLSFGTPFQLKIFQTVVERLVSAGLTLIASAGNDASDACDKFPGAINSVFTVAASTITDNVASFSNLGRCVDIFAPGERITSAWRNSNVDRATLSGTSQSAAFAAGVAALVLELDPTMKPTELKAFLQEFAQMDALSDINEDSQTMNLMLNMGELELTT